MKNNVVCSISGKELPEQKTYKAGILNDQLKKIILAKYPTWNGNGNIDAAIVNDARNEYVKSMLEEEKGQLNDLDKEVLASIGKAEFMTKKLSQEKQGTLSMGDKLADKVASFGGSWKFIITFFCILAVWIIVNGLWLKHKAFDPYPFILMNLILSCVAALQAPVIMMSQNRQEEKDRQRSQNDYQINLKAELEIRLLNEKIDHLLIHQSQRLFEMQQIQVDMIQELIDKSKK